MARTSVPDPAVTSPAERAAWLRAELERAKQPTIARDRLVDTLLLARRKYPGVSNRLDDLCARFGIDNSARTKHGALLDAQLLAECYVELLGGRQPGLELAVQSTTAAVAVMATLGAREPRPHAPDEAELAAHAAMVAQLKSPLWLEN